MCGSTHGSMPPLVMRKRPKKPDVLASWMEHKAGQRVGSEMENVRHCGFPFLHRDQDVHVNSTNPVFVGTKQSARLWMNDTQVAQPPGHKRPHWQRQSLARSARTADQARLHNVGIRCLLKRLRDATGCVRVHHHAHGRLVSRPCLGPVPTRLPFAKIGRRTRRLQSSCNGHGTISVPRQNLVRAIIDLGAMPGHSTREWVKWFRRSQRFDSPFRPVETAGQRTFMSPPTMRPTRG